MPLQTIRTNKAQRLPTSTPRSTFLSRISSPRRLPDGLDYCHRHPMTSHTIPLLRTPHLTSSSLPVSQFRRGCICIEHSLLHSEWERNAREGEGNLLRCGCGPGCRWGVKNTLKNQRGWFDRLTRRKSDYLGKGRGRNILALIDLVRGDCRSFMTTECASVIPGSTVNNRDPAHT